MRVLVTGAAGFIGSSVSEALLARGDEVVGVDDFNPYYDPSLKEANVAEVESRFPGRFQMVRADISDDAVVRPIFEKPLDVVCHLAAWAGVRPSIESPVRYVSTNVEGTTRLLELARSHGVRPFVFASSSSVYGARARGPFCEDDRVDDPISPYAATKKAGELIGYTYHHLYQTRFTALRFFTVYGPRQRPEMAIRLFADRILNGKTIRLFGDGSSSRDYTFIDDIVRGVLGAIDLTVASDGYRIYNLGCGRTTQLSELIRLIEECAGRKAIIERFPDQPGDVPVTFADITRARRDLAYNPSTPPEVGVPSFMQWLRSRAHG